MTEQPKYKLYAIRTEDLTKDGLKGFEYSLVANPRYVLVYSDCALAEPYRKLPDDIQLTDEEKKWKAECERKMTEEKIKTNVAHMKKHKDEYIEFLSGFCDSLENELKIEQKKVGEKK